MQSIWTSLLVFVLILAAIPFSAWLLRRSQGLRPGAAASLGVFSAVAVGPRERIAIVRAEQKWLVIGVTPQSVTLLTELDEAPAGAAAALAAASYGGAGAGAGAGPGERRFADLLRGMRNGSR